MNLHIQETKKTAKYDVKRSTSRQIIIKLSKDKEKEVILKAARQK